MVDFVSVLVGATAFITGFNSFLVHARLNRFNDAIDRVSGRMVEIHRKIEKEGPRDHMSQPWDITEDALQVIRHVRSIPRGVAVAFRIPLAHFVNVAMLVATAAVFMRSDVEEPAVVLAVIQLIIVVFGFADEWQARRIVPWAAELFGNHLRDTCGKLLRLSQDSISFAKLALDNYAADPSPDRYEEVSDPYYLLDWFPVIKEGDDLLRTLSLAPVVSTNGIEGRLASVEDRYWDFRAKMNELFPDDYLEEDR